MEKESQNLEFKQDRTKTYLKTVSAFANYNGGEIRFGVKDDGSILPISDPHTFALDLENQINDSISPQVLYRVVLNANNTISLVVEKGINPPYFYNGKSYKRSNTSTVEVDEYELRRLVLEGKNLTFDELTTDKKDLSFATLEKMLKGRLNLVKFDETVLKTLNLKNRNGFNNAAILLSDNNSFPGLDIVVFGKDINIFKERLDLSNQSIINQYEKAMDIFTRNYVEERVNSSYRSTFERIPKIAFKEIILNAIVHREYDIKANTKVEMYENKIIITSPGGLPKGLTEEEFLNKPYSVLRNPIIASVLRTLKLIEQFATGLARTKLAYFSADNKPRFIVSENFIQVVLPTFEDKSFLTDEELEFLNQLDSNFLYTREKLETITGLNKPKLIRILNSLIQKKYIQKIGQGKSTLYSK